MKLPRSPRTPSLGKQFLAETLGTFFLVLIGDGSIAQKTMGVSQDFTNVALGYGLALMIGILVSGGVSGGHLNPAVTLTMAFMGKCRWIQVPIYWCAQYLGAFVAAAVLYGIYADGINANVFVDIDGDIESGRSAAGIFASYPFSEDITTVTLVFDQILGTAILVVIILAVTDSKNMKVPNGLVPLLIGLGLTAIHLSFAFNAGCAVNPARDFSPRLLTLCAGFGTDTFNAFSHFFWIPWMMPHVGGLLGGFTYYTMVEMHHDDDEDDEQHSVQYD